MVHKQITTFVAFIFLATASAVEAMDQQKKPQKLNFFFYCSNEPNELKLNMLCASDEKGEIIAMLDEQDLLTALKSYQKNHNKELVEMCQITLKDLRDAKAKSLKK